MRRAWRAGHFLEPSCSPEHKQSRWSCQFRKLTLGLGDFTGRSLDYVLHVVIYFIINACVAEHDPAAVSLATRGAEAQSVVERAKPQAEHLQSKTTNNAVTNE